MGAELEDDLVAARARRLFMYSLAANLLATRPLLLVLFSLGLELWVTEVLFEAKIFNDSVDSSFSLSSSSSNPSYNPFASSCWASTRVFGPDTMYTGLTRMSSRVSLSPNINPLNNGGSTESVADDELKLSIMSLLKALSVQGN